MPHIRVRSYLHSEDGGSTFLLTAVISISEYHRGMMLDPFKILVPPTRLCGIVI